MSWNLLNLVSSARVLFCCLEKKFFCKCGCAGRHTYNALLEVFAWNCMCFMLGEHPGERHDGKAWLPSDAKRSKIPMGKSFGFLGACFKAGEIGHGTKPSLVFLVGPVNPYVGFVRPHSRTCNTHIRIVPHRHHGESTGIQWILLWLLYGTRKFWYHHYSASLVSVGLWSWSMSSTHLILEYRKEF